MKNKNFKIIILSTSGILLVLITMIVLSTLIDFYRSKNNKKPLFSYQKVSTSYSDYLFKEKPNISIPRFEGSIYKGLFYQVSVCDTNNSKYNFKLGKIEKGNCLSYLKCTKTFSRYDKHEYYYEFFDKKLHRVTTILTIPIEDVEFIETYMEEFNKINNNKNCYGKVSEKDDYSYETVQTCNILKMTDEEVMSIYSTSKNSIVKSKEKIIDSFSNDKEMICK